nr:DCC1-like thiol-disulfide oxidoreductase family protein [Moraxella osloensis]
MPYRSLAYGRKNPDVIRIMSIDDARDELAKFGISEDEAMTYLCVQDKQGNMQKGMDAVRLLYKTAQLPFATLFGWPVVKQASDRIYPIFARHRNRVPNWMTQLAYGKVAADCKDGMCTTRGK